MVGILKRKKKGLGLREGEGLKNIRGERISQAEFDIYSMLPEEVIVEADIITTFDGSVILCVLNYYL